MSGSFVFIGVLFAILIFFISLYSAFEHDLDVSVQSKSGLRRWASQQLQLRLNDHKLPHAATRSPVSPVCQMFPYDRYFRANTFEEMRQLGAKALPGDMIELVSGRHKPFYADSESTDGEGLCATWPRRAKSGTTFQLHGSQEKKITFCGHPEKTIIDGSPNLQSGAGLQVVQSSHLRFAGFTMRNTLRSVDIQDTFHSEFLYLTCSHTWHEGIRIRYNSSHNTLAFSRIQYTGRGYVGNGEAIYIGTASGRTVNCGSPSDQSNYNVVKHNLFGPSVPSENVDVKEYTTGGVIVDNVFNGTDLRGIHASVSWVALKGRGYTVANNTGWGLGVKGAGIRVLKRAPLYGSDNVIFNNTCHGLKDGSYCVFVDRRTKNNTVCLHPDAESLQTNVENAC